MLPSLTDNPVARIDDDAFGFRPYIEELHGVISAAGSLPITVGVFGPWGSGKSSFLKMWEDLLSFSPTTRTLWFNPWKYDQKIKIWAALIQSLLAEMQRESEEQLLRQKARKLATTASWLTMRGALGAAGAYVSGGLLDAKVIEQTLTEMTDQDAAFYRDINRFELDFAAAVDEFVGEDGRLVVFIDDLDRCVPDAALNVLEALKLFVGNARCVFVLSMDYDVLTTVAEKKFGRDVPVAGAAYLEKIIQLPFFLPDVGFDLLRASVDEYTGGLADNEAFWELVEAGLGSNPRRVKRYVNVLNLAVAIARREGVDGGGRTMDVTQQLRLAKLLIIRSEHRDFFHHLLLHPGAWRQLENSPALPPVDSHEPVEVERERDAAMSVFLSNARLARLMMMRPGAANPHVSAPEPDEVARMLRTVRLATGSVGDRPSRAP